MNHCSKITQLALTTGCASREQFHKDNQPEEIQLFIIYCLGGEHVFHLYEHKCSTVQDKQLTAWVQAFWLLLRVELSML